MKNKILFRLQKRRQFEKFPEKELSDMLDYKEKGTAALRVAGEDDNEGVAKYCLRKVGSRLW